jgi:hypothetical protein
VTTYGCKAEHGRILGLMAYRREIAAYGVGDQAKTLEEVCYEMVGDLASRRQP